MTRQTISCVQYSWMLHALLMSCAFLTGANWCSAAAQSDTASSEQIIIQQPIPYQVVQRQGYVPQFAHEHHPGGAATGFAMVRVVCSLPERLTSGTQLEYRLLLHDGATGRETPWTILPVEANTSADTSNSTAATTPRQSVQALIQVVSGGWYRLELRARKDQAVGDPNGAEVVAEAHVEPFGVGEVFLVAGQSYATNCNDERLQVQDPLSRVAAFSHANKTWQIAEDPQPAGDGSDGGSIWPALGDLLLPAAQVPVGFVNVAVGATATSQWLPSGPLHQRLIQAGLEVGDFRAVLWQQGESDVIAKTSTADYITNLQRIRNAAAEAWGHQRPWLLAKSTLHPTVYNDPEGEGKIRQAIDQLCLTPGFLHGPDTDVLSGMNRGPVGSRRHFTGAGQRNAAAMWYANIWQLLSQPRPAHEQVLRSLPDLHLEQPVWSSAIVHRESSILLQADATGPAVARLAFPASEILAVTSASGTHSFDVKQDMKLSEDGLQLQFVHHGPVPTVLVSDLFPPKDAPNSYRHRVGNSEQNLLYQPGKWFHERNVEITYRRLTVPQPAVEAAVSELLPRSMQRLREKRPLTIGISGDSISTGLDASLMTMATPGQPGFADLVAAQLQHRFGSEITLKNRAVAGWSVTHGLQDLDNLLAEKPQLVVVAYGMNDVGRRDPEWFGGQARTLIERIQAADPEAEIILVAPMLGNSEWIHTPRDMFALYRDQLKSLSVSGVALADVTAVWQLLLKHKHDLDLTGNGLNHPNDFGHRLYAQTLLQVLTERVSRIPAE
jgi:lysophospholipase L1-like esterase